jgi:cytochrome c553
MAKKNNFLINVAFIILCVSILIFLFNAPEETTPPLPHDDYHNELFTIDGKKEAEKQCAVCHDPGTTAPLAAEHPPPYRCLFCHKRL